MINWLHKEEGYCEGSFESAYFHSDIEDDNELIVMCKSPDLCECAEKCVEALNSLSESDIDEICKGIINHLSEENMDEDLPPLDEPTDILNCCWFTTLYVNMLNPDDETAYVLEGEGEWGEVVGFVITNNKLVYVGIDYFDYMKEEG